MIIPPKSLRNPELGKMSVADLRQRYRCTYVEYKSEPIFLHDFDTLADGTIGILYGGETHKFEWRFLNVARPPTQWYRVDNALFYLSYPFSRQWVRGLTKENCQLFTLVSSDVRVLDADDMNFATKCYIEALKPKYTIGAHHRVLTKDLSNQELVLLTPHWAYHTQVFYFRHIPVAYFNLNVNTIEVLKQDLLPELLQLIYIPHVKFDIENVDTIKRQFTDIYGYDIKKNLQKSGPNKEEILRRIKIWEAAGDEGVNAKVKELALKPLYASLKELETVKVGFQYVSTPQKTTKGPLPPLGGGELQARVQVILEENPPQFQPGNPFVWGGQFVEGQHL